MRKTPPTARLNLSRDRIVTESARTFNRLGYHATTLDEIARALGVTKAALYYHVRSKEELLFECYKMSIEIGFEGIRRAREKSSTPDEQLRLAVAYYIEGITDPERAGVVLLEERALTPDLRRQVIEWRDAYERQIREIIERGIAEDVFVPFDPKLIGFALLGAGNWVPKWHKPSGGRSGREIADTFSAYLVRGLLKHPSLDTSGSRLEETSSR